MKTSIGARGNFLNRKKNTDCELARYLAFTFRPHSLHVRPSIHDCVDQLTDIVLSNVITRCISPWWDSECDQWIQLRRDSLKAYMNNPSIKSFLETKKTYAQTRKQLRRKKRLAFNTFCASLNRNTPSKIIWDQIRRYKYGFSPNNRYLASLRVITQAGSADVIHHTNVFILTAKYFTSAAYHFNRI